MINTGVDAIGDEFHSVLSIPAETLNFPHFDDELMDIPSTHQKVVMGRKNLRTVSLGVSLPIGSALEPKPGISSVLISHLQRNTADKDEDEFAKYIDSLGISTFGSAGRTRMSLGVTSPPQHTDEAFNILKEMLFQSGLNETTMKTIVQQKAGQIKQIQSSPEPILTNYTIWKATYGDDPITKHPLGEVEPLQDISVDELERWHERLRHYKLHFAAVGLGLTEEKLGDVDSFLGEFGDQVPTEPTTSHSSTELHQEVDLPPMPSSNAYIGVNFRLPSARGLQFEENLYNAVLSGGMSARMFTEIRENRNLSYAPRSPLNRFRGGAMISSIMDVRKEKAKEALETTLHIMYDTLQSPIPEDEMRRALKAAQRIAVFVADSAQNYASFLLSRITSGLEHDLEKIKSELERTSEEQWQNKLMESWIPENLSFAASGDVGDVTDKWEEYARRVL